MASSPNNVLRIQESVLATKLSVNQKYNYINIHLESKELELVSWGYLPQH